MFRWLAVLCTFSLWGAVTFSEEIVIDRGGEVPIRLLEDIPADGAQQLFFRSLPATSTLIERAASRRALLIQTLEELQAAYFNSGMQAEAAIVQQQILQLKQHAEVELPEPPVDEEANHTPIELRGHIGEVHVVAVTGTEEGSVWGSGIYTDDSNVGTAAVHAGILEPGESGLIAFRLLPGFEQYKGSTANGVKTRDYGDWHGSYQLLGTCLREREFHEQEFEVGTRVNVFVVGRTKGDVWGTGIYSGDSNLGAAAVHAGLLVDHEGGVLEVEVLAAQSQYKSSTANGVTTGMKEKTKRSWRLKPAQRERD
ncbi:MAG: LCCL domain-containing protein [Planctomycetaceae bacterium]